jgi:hypothetical protein
MEKENPSRDRRSGESTLASMLMALGIGTFAIGISSFAYGNINDYETPMKRAPIVCLAGAGLAGMGKVISSAYR